MDVSLFRRTSVRIRSVPFLSMFSTVMFSLTTSPSLPVLSNYCYGVNLHAFCEEPIFRTKLLLRYTRGELRSWNPFLRLQPGPQQGCRSAGHNDRIPEFQQRQLFLD